MLYLATPCASDEIGSWVYGLVFGCSVASAILVVAALMLLIFEKAGVRRIATASGCLSFVPFCFTAYVHEIDFVAVAGDGTAASGPLWESLLLPGIPLFASLLMIWWRLIDPLERN
jgi:hypothetical protein